MKKLITLISLALLACLWFNATSLIDSDSDDLAQLKALNARFIHNFVTSDVPSHDRIIHPDFVEITTRGLWLNREDYLKGWKTGFDAQVYAYWDYRNEKIIIFGPTALVRAVTKFTIVQNGKETTGMTQYTDTYIKENGAWRCIQAQLTTVAPENYPGDDTIVRKYINGK